MSKFTLDMPLFLFIGANVQFLDGDRVSVTLFSYNKENGLGAVAQSACSETLDLFNLGDMVSPAMSFDDADQWVRKAVDRLESDGFIYKPGFLRVSPYPKELLFETLPGIIHFTASQPVRVGQDEDRIPVDQVEDILVQSGQSLQSVSDLDYS